MQLEVIEPEKKTSWLEKEPLISFIVPAHAGHLDSQVLKRCLMSLDDQDYENMEVIIVINGGKDEELEKVARYYLEQDSDKYKMLVLEKAGACNARNQGFEMSKGDIVSFFNSDYRAKPGMVRLWIDELLAHPDCGFAYGGYEWAGRNVPAYPSKKFDPFELENENYIDCGFPLWRKYYVPWDENVKSLQDWDFWLRVVRMHSVKGHYITRDYTFIAELPRPKGLSQDSSENWIERVEFIKKKNGIPLRDIIVTSIGAPYHGREIAKMIGADYRDHTIYKPNKYKALYLIGFFMKPTDVNNQHPQILGAYNNVPKIIHFIGADIYWLRKFPSESMRIISGVLKEGGAKILCETPLAQEELKSYNIDAEVVPIPPYNDYEIKSLPEKFKVAIFLTDKSDFDKYLQKHTLSIVKAMPDIEFSAYGDACKDFSYPNFKHYGNLDKEQWKQFVYDNSVLLRLVRHDTLPLAGCEFLLAGRQFISNIPMNKLGHYYIPTQGDKSFDSWDTFSPGFSDLRWPRTKENIAVCIRNTKIAINKMTEETHKYYSDLLDKKKYIAKIHELAGGEHA